MTQLLPPNSIIVIYFFYGLAYFSLGLAALLEAQRAVSGLPFARAMLPLAAFALIHGGHEWLEMFIREAALHGYEDIPLWLEAVRVGALAISFAALVAFGVKVLYPRERLFSFELYAAGAMLLFWAATVLVLGLIIQPGDAMRLTVRSWLLMGDAWSRYSLAIPGAFLSGYALARQARSLAPAQRRFAPYLYLAALTFFVYGAVGQLFVTESYLFPSNLINEHLFQSTLGIPIQLVRACMAMVLALTLIPTLNMFELERQQTLATAQQRARDELARREALRREMLQHTVAAQEEERRRIARELHDEIGQTLTALSLGLENLAQMVASGEQERLADAAKDLRQMTSNAVSELDHLVTDLRPSQLDHLGLGAAMRSLAKDYRQRFGLKVDLEFAGQRRRLPSDVELAIFRIAQEALTNVGRHAQVDEAQLRLSYEPQGVRLCIADQGRGFVLPDVPHHAHKNWGLLGMTERAAQVGGSLSIETAPGQGTKVLAWLPLNGVPPQENRGGEGKGSDERDSADSAGR